MDINDFINKFYTDSDYQERIVNELKSLESHYENSELQEHQEILDNLHYEMLFNRITNEIYSKKLNINLTEKEI